MLRGRLAFQEDAIGRADTAFAWIQAAPCLSNKTEEDTRWTLGPYMIVEVFKSLMKVKVRILHYKTCCSGLKPCSENVI